MAMQRESGSNRAAHRLAPALACLIAWALAACSSGGGHVQTAGGQEADPETTDFPIFYVKRYSVPKTQDDLRLLRFAQPSADLFMRTRAAPDGTEINITQRVTGTGSASAASYDIKDVSVSADGKTILFAMRGPLAAKQEQDKPPYWRLWQYVIATDTLSQVVDPSLDPDAGVADVNDVGPQFLPDGRIVFTSTRQVNARAAMIDANLDGGPYIANDEDGTEPAFVLHVMNGDGTNIHEISFNASHDRDPTVLSNGRVMWSRWDDAPGNTHAGMSLYTANPDGTDVELLYGANSHQTGPNGTANANATVEFVKTHEMQDGRILALIRPFTGTESTTAPLGEDFGGDLVIIDTKDYVENTQPTLAGAGLSGPAQTPATSNDVITIPGPSPGGRFYAGYPLWDGTNRILVSWSQCRLMDTSVTPSTLLPCTAANLANPQLVVAPPIYSVWMFDPTTNTMQPIMQPTDGIMITDLVAAQPRALPNVILDGSTSSTLASSAYDGNVGTVGVIDIRSVYDFDGVDRAPGGIAAVADPAKTSLASCQQCARFVRLETAVPLPDPGFLKLNVPRAAFGVASAMRRILAYAPVQPDGSVRIEVPAQVPFQVSVLDQNAQRILPAHTAWLQVEPGEELKCNGCHTPAAQQNPPPGQTAHSHGRSGLFDSAYPGAATTGVPFPNTNPTYMPNAGETMAETLARWSCSQSPPCLALVPSTEVLYTDIWTNTSAGLTANPPITLSYLTTNAPPGKPYYAMTTAFPTSNTCAIAGGWQAGCRITINYEDHIQPLWSKKRQDIDVTTGAVVADHTCTNCHSPRNAAGNPQVPAGQLDLSATPSMGANAPEFVSYVDLLTTHDQLQLVNGVLEPVTEPGPPDANGNPTTITLTSPPALIAGDAHDSTVFFGLLGPASTDSTHAGILSPSELRLISEWLDIGAQYYNDPFEAAQKLN